MPKIKTAVLRYVCQRERDEQISLQCERLASITLDQLRVKPSLQSPELVPFIDSVTHLRYSSCTFMYHYRHSLSDPLYVSLYY